MNLKTAIVCENDIEIATGISSSLHTAFPCCDLISTNSGSQCIKISQEKSPDIFILGLDITDMCGFELIRTIRCLFDNYIIVLSNTGNDDELLKTMKEGADRYIKKETWKLELITRIKNINLR
jgi:two-component system KDP operon response regulator KdpE